MKLPRKGFVFNDYRTRTHGCVTQMLDNLKLEPLEDRCRRDRLSMFYKMQHDLVGIPSDMPVRDSRTRGPDSRMRGQSKFCQEKIT